MKRVDGMNLAGVLVALLAATAATLIGPSDRDGSVRAPAPTTTLEVVTLADGTRALVDAGGDEFASLPEPYNTANYAAGKRTFKLCQSCHTTAEGGGNLVGPNLHGVFGRAAGSKEGFAFSDAMTNSGIVWSGEELDKYLETPAKYIPGNRMTFAGVRKPDDRKAVIAYLMLETGYTGE